MFDSCLLEAYSFLKEGGGGVDLGEKGGRYMGKEKGGGMCSECII